MRIAYVNTWGGFEDNGYPEQCFFSRILREIDPSCSVEVGYDSAKTYDLVISMYRPIVGSRFYTNMKQVEATSICFTGESYDVVRTTPGCDAYVGFDLKEDVTDDVRYFRFPLYAAYHMGNLEKYGCSSFEEVRGKFVGEKQAKISSLVSNPSNELRTSLLGHLVSTGVCASGGRVHNNVGDVDDKLDFISKYSVGMAFENLSRKSYITEKIYEVLAVNAVPFYWGAVDIAEEFNPESYIRFDQTNNNTAHKSYEDMLSLLTDSARLSKMAKIDPISGFRSENYIRNGKQMMKDFLTEMMEVK